nr:phasin [Methylorubrum extorquens]
MHIVRRTTSARCELKERDVTNTPNYEVPTEMRDFAEKSVEQARKAFDSFIGAARRTADTVQGSTDLARSNATSISSRGFEYAEQNVNAAFDLAQKLVRSRDVQEAMQHQAEFVRAQFAAIQAQAKEFGGLAQSAFQQSAENAKSAMQQGAADARQAYEQGVETARENANDAQKATS